MYGTIETFRTYQAARGNSAPTEASDTLATAALVRGSDMIRLRYVSNLLPGYDATFQPAGFDYPLAEEAAYIAAALELETPGFFSRTFTAAEQKVLVGVGQIKWQVVGDSSKTYAAMPVSTLIDALFWPYISDPDDDGFMLRSIGPGACV